MRRQASATQRRQTPDKETRDHKQDAGQAHGTELLPNHQPRRQQAERRHEQRERRDGPGGIEFQDMAPYGVAANRRRQRDTFVASTSLMRQVGRRQTYYHVG